MKIRWYSGVSIVIPCYSILTKCYLELFVVDTVIARYLTFLTKIFIGFVLLLFFFFLSFRTLFVTPKHTVKKDDEKNSNCSIPCLRKLAL